mmetsp:Transcript_50352/g.146077  ORF Transcript_50352/g.146077 Transcript_50352/m.146077 type:complete len:311 (+) Transcript_50352:83-1015(+)
MELCEVFDRLWPLYCKDIGFDQALAAEAAAAVAGDAKSIEELLMCAFERSEASLNLRGVSLAVLLLEKLDEAGLEVKGPAREALATLRDPEVLEDITLDVPRAPQFLSEVEASLGLDSSQPRRLRILAVRNGFAPDSACARALRDVADLRIPGSAYVAETGNEDAQGRGEQETVEVLREHLRGRPVDLVIARSRGCRLLSEHLVGDGIAGEASWRGPVLALSPADPRYAEALWASPASAVLVAACGADVVDLQGSHAVLTLEDVERLGGLAAKPGRSFVYQQERQDWADELPTLIRDAVGHAADALPEPA